MRTHVELCLGILVIICLSFVVPASADTLYSNGGPSGMTGAVTICCTYKVADSFDLTAKSDITGVTFYTWTYPGYVPTKVDWSITTEALGGTTLASGTASLSATYLDVTHGSFQGAYWVYADQFAISGVTLDPGTYWLQLYNAGAVGQGDNSDMVFWDVNNGPSQRVSNGNIGSLGSEAFAIEGRTDLQPPVGAVPEPATLALLGTGLVAVARLVRRKQG